MILRRKFRRGVAELHKPKGGAKGLKFGKWFAHEMRTGNKMLFCSPRIEIPAYQMPPAVAVLP